MSNVYVTSDWHFGHNGITDRFRKQFPSLAVMEEHILSNALKVLMKRDVLFCIGDMAFDQRGLDKLSALPCRKIFIRGNHDTLPLESYVEAFDDIHGAMRYKGCFVTHIPIHEMELFRGYNIHGHCHRGGPRELQKGDHWRQYYNAIVEFNNYQVVPMAHVLRTLARSKEC